MTGIENKLRETQGEDVIVEAQTERELRKLGNKEFEGMYDKENIIPRIAIVGRVDYKNGMEVDYVYQAYAECVSMCGALPIILPRVSCQNLQDAREIMKDIDGIILTGGEDLHPKHYGEEEKIKTSYDIKKENAEFNLIKIADTDNKPILAICGGSQKLNVYFGGSLHQDIYMLTESTINHTQKDKRTEGVHKVYKVGTGFDENIRMCGKEFMVNSVHHQAINQLGDGLEVCLKAEDGIIEGFRHLYKPFVVGVQYHPEALIMGDSSKGPNPSYAHHMNLFDSLVEYAKR